MQKIIDYIILSDDNETGLCRDVMDMIKLGYVPHGGVTITSHVERDPRTNGEDTFYAYAQAMIKYEDPVQ